MNENILNDIFMRLLKAFKNISPDYIEFLDYEESFQGKPLIHVLVVSKGLENIRQATRWRICEDLIDQKDPQLSDNYGFNFQTYTPQEYELIKKCRHKLH